MTPTRAPRSSAAAGRAWRSSTSGPSRPGNGLLSEALARALHRTVDAGERAVCVLNRKGRAKLLTCLSCSTVATCERCDAAVIEVGAGGAHVPALRDDPADDLHRVPRTRSCARRASGCSACATRWRRSCPAPRSRGSTRRSTDVPDAPVVVGTEAVLHRVPAKLVAFLDLDQELFAQRVRAGQQAAGLLARAARLVGRT